MTATGGLQGLPLPQQGARGAGRATSTVEMRATGSGEVEEEVETPHSTPAGTSHVTVLAALSHVPAHFSPLGTRLVGWVRGGGGEKAPAGSGQATRKDGGGMEG